jgi:hypothetical protein
VFGPACKPACPKPECVTCPAAPADAGSAGGVAYASISVKCGKDTYTVSTGTSAGNCKTTKGANNQVEGATCTDDKGNGASLSCVGGVGACESSSGAGSCDIKLGKD